MLPTAAQAEPVLILHPTQCALLCSWAYQVLHVQRMVNDAPTTALGGMTRSESLFGAPSTTEKLPKAEEIIKLLGFTK